jgi:Ca2+-binding RTX toxin-like protein
MKARRLAVCLAVLGIPFALPAACVATTRVSVSVDEFDDSFAYISARGDGDNDITLGFNAQPDMLLISDRQRITLKYAGNSCDRLSRKRVRCRVRGSWVAEVFGGAGNDRLRANRTVPATVRLYGMKGKDRLVGGPSSDDLLGGAKRDVVRGRRGADSVHGDAGKGDRVYGGRGFDKVVAGDLGTGTDVGPDRAYGGRGQDSLYADDYREKIMDCGRGGDVAYLDEGNPTKIVNCEKIIRFPSQISPP